MHKNGTIYKLNIKPSYSGSDGEIIGIFVGDGSQYFEPKKYHYEVNVHFGVINYDYALYVRTLYERFFQKKFRLQLDSPTQLRLRTCSKEIFNFFYNYLLYDRHKKHSTVRLKSVSFSNKFNISFLRGLFDTDGCLKEISRENRIKIFYTTTSKVLAAQVHKLLNELKIKNKVYIRKEPKWKDVYIVNVWKESTNKFINIIQPFKAIKCGLVAKSGTAESTKLLIAENRIPLAIL